MRIVEVVSAEQAFVEGAAIVAEYQRMLLNLMDLMERAHRHQVRCQLGQKAAKKKAVWAELGNMVEATRIDLERICAAASFPIVPDQDEIIEPEVIEPK